MTLKRRMAWLYAILLIFMLTNAALAEEGAGPVFWTTLDDSCYHAREGCSALGEGRYALSEEAALMFDKQRCPVCFDGEAVLEGAPVKASVRGGTWVLKFPKRLLDSFLLHTPEQEALQYSLPMLYARTLTDSSDLRVAVTDNGSLIMNIRVIDGDCYVVERPPEDYSQENPMHWEARKLERSLFDDTPSMTGVSDPQETVPDVSEENYTRDFEAKFDNGDIAVYSTLGVNVAVIHWKSEAEPGMYCQVTIGDIRPGIPVEGYSGKKHYVYCCILTEAELAALKAGAAVGVEDLYLQEEALPEDDGTSVYLPNLSVDGQ